MSSIDTLYRQHITISPVLLGYTLLRAVALAIAKGGHTYLPHEGIGGFNPVIRVVIRNDPHPKAVNLRLGTREGDAISLSDEFGPVTLATIIDINTSESDAKTAISLFESDLQETIEIARAEPLPEPTLYCPTVHFDGLVEVDWDEELQFWYCKEDGEMHYKEELLVRFGSPFDPE